MAKKDRESSVKKRMNLWQFLRDVLVASINKGQFPLAVVALIVCLLILKMPPDDVSKLVFQIFDNIKNFKLAGYLWGIIATIGWFIHIRIQRNVLNNEIMRVSDEKTTLQKMGIGEKNIKSSKK